MWASYRYQVKNLNKPISDTDNNRIDDFLQYLNYIITNVYDIYPKQQKEIVNTWCNMARQLGLILQEWLDNESSSIQIKTSNQQKWIHMINLDRKNDNFMFRGQKTMWNGLPTASKQNTDDQAIKHRLDRVNQYYNNPTNISRKYGIIPCTNNHNFDSNDSSDSD